MSKKKQQQRHVSIFFISKKQINLIQFFYRIQRQTDRQEKKSEVLLIFCIETILFSYTDWTGPIEKRVFYLIRMMVMMLL
jgi:hypothetical protein